MSILIAVEIGSFVYVSLCFICYSISRSTLFSWKQRQKRTGTLVSPLPNRPLPRKIDRDKLRAYVEQNPDAYLAGIAEQFNCTAPAVFCAIKTIVMTYKKQQTSPSKSSKYLDQLDTFDDYQKVYIDETSVDTCIGHLPEL